MAHPLDAFGESKPLYAWADDPRCAVSRKTLVNRLAAGFTLEQALVAPASRPGSPTGSRGVAYSAFGESKTLGGWAADPRCAVSRSGLRRRLAMGQSLEDAMTAAPLRRPTFGAKVAFGEAKTLAKWVADERCVVSYQTVLARLAAGMALEAALTATTTQRRDAAAATYVAFGESKTLGGWVADERCTLDHPSTLHARIHRLGMSVEEAISAPRMERSSAAEGRLCEFLRGEGEEVEVHNRTVLAPLEIDIYLPRRRLGIEYNGVYWHSERYVGRSYHHDKWRAAQAAGIGLVQVWQDDYLALPQVVHAMLRHRLGRSKARVMARTTTPAEVPPSAAREFFGAHHLQGYVPATVHVGLWAPGGDLVAMASLRREQAGRWTLSRYATALTVPGGFTKCLAYFCRSRPWGEIRTFADLCVSNGDLYRVAGFHHDGVVGPDYRYVVDGRRVHKFNYRLQRFRNDPALSYVEGLTESELAELNDIPRIWDAGKTRWVLTALY